MLGRKLLVLSFLNLYDGPIFVGSFFSHVSCNNMLCLWSQASPPSSLSPCLPPSLPPPCPPSSSVVSPSLRASLPPSIGYSTKPPSLPPFLFRTANRLTERTSIAPFWTDMCLGLNRPTVCPTDRPTDCPSHRDWLTDRLTAQIRKFPIVNRCVWPKGQRPKARRRPSYVRYRRAISLARKLWKRRYFYSGWLVYSKSFIKEGIYFNWSKHMM